MKVSKNSLISKMIAYPFIVFFSKSWWPLPETSCMYFLRGVLTGLFNILIIFSLFHSVLVAGVVFSDIYLGTNSPLELRGYIDYVTKVGGIFYVTSIFIFLGVAAGFIAPMFLSVVGIVLVIGKVGSVLYDSGILKTGIGYLRNKLSTIKMVNIFLLKVSMHLIPVKLCIKKIYNNVHNKLCKKIDYEEK